jgi:hypothetical protein
MDLTVVFETESFAGHLIDDVVFDRIDERRRSKSRMNRLAIGD